MAKQVKDVYAGALFSLAQEEDRIDGFLEESSVLLKALEENPELILVMTHPQVSEEEKKSALENIFKNRISDELFSLLDMLREKGHFEALSEVLLEFTARVKEYRHIGVVHVSVPMELSEAQKKELEKKLIDTTDYVSLEMHYQTDPSLIGGMVIRIGDRVVDSSIRTRLESMAQMLSTGR